jgi:hypothetical protein
MKSLGWVVVAGDGWAIGLSSDPDPKTSTALAGEIAEALGGTVER